MDIRETVKERYGKIAASMEDSESQQVTTCCPPPTPAPETSCCPPLAPAPENSCCPPPTPPAPASKASCCPSTQPAQQPQAASLVTSCCGPTSAILSDCDPQITDISVNYQGVELSGLPKEAIEASLGCANPIVFANLTEGETVLDLGSGGGIDVLLASRFVGESGKVYGLDMTDEMLALANKNKERMGVTNVEFLKGYIEDIPLPDESVDVVLSNCVINLCEDKKVALAETFRVIKPGGRLRVADVVSLKNVAKELRKNAEMWCGCLAGTISILEYGQILKECGFVDINIEVAHIYTKEVIRSEFLTALENDLPDMSLDALDGAFAGALISAEKP